MSAHEHIYATYVGYDPHADTITAQCACGSVIVFPAQSGPPNRVSAWSAHGAGVVEVEADERRFVDDKWGVDETDR